MAAISGKRTPFLLKPARKDWEIIILKPWFVYVTKNYLFNGNCS
jgi:hypothetical protein